MSQYSVVGARLPRVDAVGKVTGEAVYSGDIALPNMLHGKVLRSPCPHAVVKRLDTSKASALNGVRAVITASDVPAYKKKSELSLAELPRLAKGKVFYAGQPVAAVAASTEEIAEKALDLIEVEYEELAPMLDPLEAVDPSFPPIHNDLYTNVITNPEPGKDERPSNVAYHIRLNKGDLETGFKEADIVLEKTYRTQKVHHGYIEPFVAVAATDAGGKVTVWTQCQGWFMARQMMAAFMDLPPGMIRIVPVEIGGAFGGKTYLPVAPLCALLSIKSGSPVRMEMTREEVLRDSRPAPESVITVKMGVTREGAITAASASLIFDGGAFPEMSHAMFTSRTALCQYRIANVSVDVKDVVTNKVPSAFYRAPATPQGHFAVESHMDMLAEAVGMDPLAFRIKNVAGEGDVMPNGEALPRVGFRQTMEKMAEHLRHKGPLAGKNRGRGVACGFWAGAVGSFGAFIHVNNDGSVNLVLGIADISGSRTSFAQIVAEELCLPPDRVNVVIGDTDTAPWATMSVGSTTVYSASVAVYNACRDVKAQLASLAAEKLEVKESEIEFSNGLFNVKGSPDRSISFTNLARTTSIIFGRGPVLGRGKADPFPVAPTLSVHAVDVEVDDETGKVTVLSYTAAQDVGLAINPLAVEGQMQGAVTQGIGWALMEGYILDNGVVQNATLLDYKMPSAPDIPMIDTMIVEVPSSRGVYGLRHAGEPPMIPTLAALANAVYRATGVRFQELPMTPEVVLRGIGNK